MPNDPEIAQSQELTPEQVKAGRALLAWSQQELAAQARVGTSTIADFERGLRTPVANNAQAIREALEKQGLKFIAGGVVEQAMLPPPLLALRPGTLMRWVTATHLSEWAGRRDAQSTLPELISRLIYATLGPAATILFPSDESVQHPGWDGICTVPKGDGVIPDGMSVWELGAQRTGIKGKADDDYKKRSRDSLGVNPATATFIFVTPGRFSNKTAWEAAKRAEKVWRDVRVVDADILVHWLERCPAVAQWLAEKMNRRPKGLRSLHEMWEEWCLATKPALTSDIILADRDDESTAVLKWLKGPPEIFTLKAESPDEAIAFLYASIARLPPNYRLWHESRCVITTDANVARDLVGLGTPLIIAVYSGDRGLVQRLVDDGHYVFSAYAEDIVGAVGHKLPRPWRFTLRTTLIASGVSEADAFRLSKASGRSLAVLRRLMPPALNKIPSWATLASAELNAAMLAGGWDENSAIDRKIVSMLAGKPYADVETSLAPLAAMESGPLRRIGSIWKLTSLHDAWPLLAPSVTKAQFSLFEKAFQQVLGTPNPRFDITDYSKYVEREGQFGSEVSRVLRRGLSEAMIALGVFPDEAKALTDANLRSERAVRQLLSDADAQLWWSLRDEFRELAEAAPTAFLESVEAALDGDDPAIMSLFRSDEGLLFSQEYLSDLLWSLEVLARSPDHLPQAALLLAHLAAIDPGGKTANRPANSLRQIFLAWTPQTYATAEQRLKVIDSITKRYPKVGWNLLLALAPRDHDTSQPSPHPQWRDFAPDEHETITWNLLAKAAREIGKRLLSNVGKNEQRWEKLLGRWANFEQAWRKDAADQLLKFVRDLTDPTKKEPLRDKLRDLVQKHRNFSDAHWAMPEEDLKPFDETLAALEPVSASEKYRWLFRSNSNFIRPNVAWEELQREQLDLQKNAATALLAELTPDQFLEFGESVTLHRALGIAAASSSVSEQIKLEVLERTLKDSRDSAADIGMGMTISFAESRGLGWLESLWESSRQQAWGERAELRIVRALPNTAQTWDRIAARSASLEQSYWNTMRPPFPAPDDIDFKRVTDKLLQAGRSREAMEWLAHNLAKKPSAELLVSVLRAFPAAGAKSGNDSMFSHYLGEILNYLESDGSVPEDELVQLEWIYFQALRHSQRKPKTLSRAIARNAEFFAQLICMIYLPEKNSGIEEPPPQNREQAEKLATQAFHVMHDWSHVPGADNSGHINGAELEVWMRTARKICADAGRSEIGDQKIGEVLAAAPREPDQPWPPEPVRDVIETVRSRHLEQGVMLGVINRRGVTVRSPLDGGEQERELAARYRHDADELRFEWPRTAAVLDRIADSYEHDAKREDIGAELRDLE